MLMWLNKNIAVINIMLKILNITSLRYIYMDLEQVVLTQTYIFLICRCIKWTEVDTSGPNRLNGQNRTEWEQGGPNKNEWTDQDQSGHMDGIGTNRTEYDQSGLNRTILDGIGPMSI